MGFFKASPREIIRKHYRTFVDARTGRRRLRDFVEFALPPVAVLAVLLAFKVELSANASAGLLTASGLLGGFLFAVMLQVAQRAMEWADHPPRPGPAASEHDRLLRELAANAGYASIICIAAAIAYVVAATSVPDALPPASAVTPASGKSQDDPPLALWISSSVGLALGVHLIQTLLMVMKRVFAVTEERLNRASTGADRDPPSST